jgi:hypothetical protein
MNNRTQFYLAVASAIILFDVIASLTSRALEFDYTSLAWVSWCLYIASGYFGYKFHGLLGGVAAGSVAGAADSTAGWMLSSAIGPYIPFKQPDYNPVIVAVVVTVVTLKATFFGFIGAFSGRLTGGRHPPTDA